MPNVARILHVLTPETEDGVSGSLDLIVEPRHRALYSVIVQLDVTVVLGMGPKLDVVIEESVDDTNWHELLSFTQKNTPGNQLMKAPDPAQYLRARWIITGTNAAFTFSVSFVTRS